MFLYSILYVPIDPILVDDHSLRLFSVAESRKKAVANVRSQYPSLVDQYVVSEVVLLAAQVGSSLSVFRLSNISVFKAIVNVK